MMVCKRCGCTDAQPCPGGCAWSLPDVCSRCLTDDEERMEAQYASMVDGLRAELEQDRFERFLLAVTQGMAANPGINIESCRAETFVVRAFELALGLSEASATTTDDEGDEGDRKPESRLVLP